MKPLHPSESFLCAPNCLKVFVKSLIWKKTLENFRAIKQSSRKRKRNLWGPPPFVGHCGGEEQEMLKKGGGSTIRHQVLV